jgi:3-deoxy-D-manno-octulosonic-acid transferase
VGGAFGKGLHNTLEAAAFGLPLFFGPRYEKFREARDLVSNGSAFVVHDAAEMQQALAPLLSNASQRQRLGNQARTYVQEEAGATAQIMQWLSTNKHLSA